MKYKDFYEGLLLERDETLILYHGSKQKFEIFSSDFDIGVHLGTMEQAKHFARPSGWIYEVEVKLTNIVKVNRDVFERHVYKTTRDMIRHVPEEWRSVAIRAHSESSGYDDYKASKLARDVWLSAGVDGFKYINKFEGDKGCESNVAYIILNPKSIKIMKRYQVREEKVLENCESDNVQLAYIQDGQISDDDMDDKFPDLWDQIHHLEKTSDISILRGKELNQILIEGDKIVGALYTELDNDGEFSFDLIVHPQYRNKGYGDRLIKAGISEYKALKNAYDSKLKLRVDVVNPQLFSTFKKNGLRVIKDISNSRKIMGI